MAAFCRLLVGLPDGDIAIAGAFSLRPSTFRFWILPRLFWIRPHGDKLTHVPTGATFWMGDKDVVCCEPGRLRLETGDDYKLDELKDEAWRIMTVERKSCT